MSMFGYNNGEAQVFDDQLPVEEDWITEHAGERWSFKIGVTLDQLIGGDIEMLNTMVDEATGCMMTDLDYALDGTEDDVVYLIATGDVESL